MHPIDLLLMYALGLAVVLAIAVGLGVSLTFLGMV